MPERHRRRRRDQKRPQHGHRAVGATESVGFLQCWPAPTALIVRHNSLNYGDSSIGTGIEDDFSWHFG
jgi:hypothetical protein